MGLEILFFTQICVGILMIVFLLKITQIKQQLDDIIKEVNDYIEFLTEDVREEPKTKKEKKDTEAQSQLIHAVLREYFP